MRSFSPLDAGFNGSRTTKGPCAIVLDFVQSRQWQGKCVSIIPIWGTNASGSNNVLLLCPTILLSPPPSSLAAGSAKGEKQWFRNAFMHSQCDNSIFGEHIRETGWFDKARKQEGTQQRICRHGRWQFLPANLVTGLTSAHDWSDAQVATERYVHAKESLLIEQLVVGIVVRFLFSIKTTVLSIPRVVPSFRLQPWMCGTTLRPKYSSNRLTTVTIV